MQTVLFYLTKEQKHVINILTLMHNVDVSLINIVELVVNVEN